MVAAEAEANRKASTALVQDNPDKLLRLIESQTEEPTLFAPAHHPVLPSDVNLKRLGQVACAIHERNPKDFEMLLGTPNVGPATVRSLALIAELNYDAPVSHRDPAKGQPGQAKAGEAPEETRSWADYSYAHGGKDGHPFPVDRMTYDRNIAVLIPFVLCGEWRSAVGTGHRLFRNLVFAFSARFHHRPASDDS